MMGTAHTPEQQKQVLRLIWMAMLGAVIVYGATCLLIVGTSASAVDEPERFRTAFTVAAIILGALSIWWWRHFLSAEPARTGVESSMQFTQLQTHSVIVWALSDAVAACGLVLACLVRSFAEFLPFGVAGAVLLIRHHPFRLPFDRLRVTA